MRCRWLFAVDDEVALTLHRRPRGLATKMVVVLVAVSCMFASSAGGQPMDLRYPNDSVAWWPLTEELSPGELRKEYEDPARNLERFTVAVNEGLEDPLADNRALRFYYHPAHSPHLMPLWLAFDNFARTFVVELPRVLWEPAMRSHGLDEDSISLVLNFCEEYRQSFDKISAEVWPKQRMFLEREEAAFRASQPSDALDAKASAAQKPATDLENGRLQAFGIRLRDLGRQGKLEQLGAALGVASADAGDLFTALTTSPAIVAAEKVVPELRGLLGERAWNRFRTFLLDEVASKAGSHREETYTGVAHAPQ